MLRRNSSKKELTTKQIVAQFHDFLASSLWSLPIATFIEQQSIVFDRSQGEAGEKEYRDIHKEYAGLVETLLDCFCGDANIPSQKLHDSIKTMDREKMNVKQRGNLEPVAAAHDFDVFVPMMMRKNVELQLQALQMIEFMCGLLPTVLQLEEGETLKDKKVLSPEETERYVLISVMRQSKEEFDEQNAAELRDDLERLAISGEEERRRLTDEKEKEEKLLEKAMSTRDEESTPTEKEPEKRPTTSAHTKRPQTSGMEKGERPATAKRKTSMNREKSTEMKTATQLNSVRRPSLPVKPRRPSTTAKEETTTEQGPRRKNVNDVHALLQEKTRLNTADVEERKRYLQEQRNKLMAMKQTERDKHLQEASSRAAQERPRTATAARGAMRNQEDVIAARRALVHKLKSEVTS